MEKDYRADILAKCIDDVLAGVCSPDECLSRYPELRSELEPLLMLATKIEPLSALPSLSFKNRTRRELLQLSERNGGTWQWPNLARWLGWLSPSSRLIGVPLTAVLMVAVVIGGGGTLYASQGSLPDDVLYPVKTSTENVRLYFTLGAEAKANLHVSLAERRIDEIVTQSRQGKSPSVASVSALGSQIDSGIRATSALKPEASKAVLGQLSDMVYKKEVALAGALAVAGRPSRDLLIQAMEATRRGEAIAQIAGRDVSFLSSQPSVMDNRLTPFDLEGVVASVDGDMWNIGGVVISNVSVAPSTPAVGTYVKIQGITRTGQVLVGSVAHRDSINGSVRIVGLFGGAILDGKLWHVGGVPVIAPEGLLLPVVGTPLDLTGVIKDGKFIVSPIGNSTGVYPTNQNGAVPSPDDIERWGGNVDGNTPGDDSDNGKRSKGDRNKGDD